MTEKPPGIRLDKWLWHARFFKTRSLCAKLVKAGHVRVNEVKVTKASIQVRVGDGLVFPQADTLKILRVLELGKRRGPAPEAQALYEDLTPETAKTEYVPVGPNNDRKGRPTKKDRRVWNKMLHGFRDDE